MIGLSCCRKKLLLFLLRSDNGFGVSIIGIFKGGTDVAVVVALGAVAVSW